MYVRLDQPPSQNKIFKCTSMFGIIVIALQLFWILSCQESFKFLTSPYKAATKPKMTEESSKFSTTPYKATTKPTMPVKPTLPAQCGPGHIVPEGDKVAVKRTKTVLLSAYREHRTGTNEVRVISVVLRKKTEAYHCHLCCQEKLYISEGVSSLHSDHFGFAYGTADIMCPMPSGCEAASHITVTSAAGDSEDKLDKEFLDVKNQRANDGTFPYIFTICLSTMFDFTNVLQLVQSLEMMQLLGVNRVAIYKTSCSPETQRILDYYTNKGLVEVIPWSLSRFLTVSRSWLPGHGPGDLHYFGQIAALNDCVYRYMYQSRYVALHDIDELILPQTVDSWSALLPLLEKTHGVDRCYKFENYVFPHTIKFPPPTSQTLPQQSPSWKNVPGVNILAHLYHEPIIEVKWEKHNSNFKIIVNPRIVFSATVHGLLSPQNNCSWVKRDIARMYHTRTAMQPKLKPDQLIYDGRLLNYSARLIKAVNTVLRDCGFL